MSDKQTTVLPDGSAFFTVSLPLPDDHWLYQQSDDHESPPMQLRLGTDSKLRREMTEVVINAVRYALRSSTGYGRHDWDPDAVVQNVVVALLGYYTPDGLSGEAWDPDPVPDELAALQEHIQEQSAALLYGFVAWMTAWDLTLKTGMDKHSDFYARVVEDFLTSQSIVDVDCGHAVNALSPYPPAPLDPR